MKKTYQKPASKVMNLGLKSEYLADGIGVTNSYAIKLEEDKQINGGDALVKDGGAWDTDGLWN